MRIPQYKFRSLILTIILGMLIGLCCGLFFLNRAVQQFKREYQQTGIGAPSEIGDSAPFYVYVGILSGFLISSAVGISLYVASRNRASDFYSIAKKRTEFVNKLLIITIISLLSTQTIFAQNKGYLKGTIKDSAGGAVSNNRIYIEGPTTSETKTDEDGKFFLELPAGTYHIRTDKIPGFVPFEHDEIKIKPDKITNLKVKLKVTDKDAVCVVWITASPQNKPKEKQEKRMN